MQPNKTRILVASLVLGCAQLALAADPPAQERDRTYAKVCGFCHDKGVGPAILGRELPVVNGGRFPHKSGVHRRHGTA